MLSDTLRERLIADCDEALRTAHVHQLVTRNPPPIFEESSSGTLHANISTPAYYGIDAQGLAKLTAMFACYGRDELIGFQEEMLACGKVAEASGDGVVMAHCSNIVKAIAFAMANPNSEV